MSRFEFKPPARCRGPMPKIPLEDNVNDILGKAMRGLGFDAASLGGRAGIAQPAVERALAAADEPAVVARLAALLGLAPEPLLALSREDWYPDQPPDGPGFLQFNTPYGDMAVNSYLLWDLDTREAVAFDAGADCSAMLESIARERLSLRLILLTHTHEDHVADLPHLIEETGATVHAHHMEAETGMTTFREGAEFRAGALRIETRLTRGHSPGGTTFVVYGHRFPLAVVGDSLFAGSMGGSRDAYREALKNNLEQILTLPDETVLCPGHGPLTTVGQEKRRNPFFASA
jgi:hydroxyacylglutathione hydrolase